MKKVFLVIFAAIFVSTAAGCATAPKQNNEMEGLRNQISTLEEQVKVKDDEIANLKEELTKSTPAIRETGTAEGCMKTSPKAIQTALKNTGYYNGPIDGFIGKQTRDAIKAFQKANNLKVDGRVGSKTWSILKNYLEKKVK